jgi:hypothetical protein
MSDFASTDYLRPILNSQATIGVWDSIKPIRNFAPFQQKKPII